jgi:methylenetetrahydrofolate--tRNA-(uracil-5-)-methyltransferase
MTGIHAARAILGLPPIDFPRESAFGAVVAHLQNRTTHDFQPSNVTWSFEASFDFAQDDTRVAKLGKRERRRLFAERALASIEALAAETLYAPAGY